MLSTFAELLTKHLIGFFFRKGIRSLDEIFFAALLGKKTNLVTVFVKDKDFVSHEDQFIINNVFEVMG